MMSRKSKKTKQLLARPSSLSRRNHAQNFPANLTDLTVPFGDQ